MDSFIPSRIVDNNMTPGGRGELDRAILGQLHHRANRFWVYRLTFYILLPNAFGSKITFFIYKKFNAVKLGRTMNTVFLLRLFILATMLSRTDDNWEIGITL